MRTLGQMLRDKYVALAKADERAYDARRGSASARGYGRAWAARRAAYLASHPWCAVEGCREPAVEVDHIVPRRRGGSDDETNLQGLCRRHHSAKTVRQDGGLGRPAAPGKGVGRVDA